MNIRPVRLAPWGRGGQADDEQAGVGVTEAWNGPAPVDLVLVRPAPGGRHPEAVLPKAGARLAGDHLLGQLVEELGPAWASVSMAPPPRPAASCPLLPRRRPTQPGRDASPPSWDGGGSWRGPVSTGAATTVVAHRPATTRVAPPQAPAHGGEMGRAARWNAHQAGATDAGEEVNVGIEGLLAQNLQDHPLHLGGDPVPAVLAHLGREALGHLLQGNGPAGCSL